MNNRLSIPEIAGLITEQTGIERKKTERFLKEFVLLVRDVVFEEKLLKVKGMGTFKIVEVQPRESVDVNTGNRILIPGHYKFSFIPDKELREDVNKPFSFFETVEISDHIATEDMEHKEEDSVSDDSTISEPEIKEEIVITNEDLPEVQSEEEPETTVITEVAEEYSMPESEIGVKEFPISEEKQEPDIINENNTEKPEEEPEIKEPDTEQEAPVEEPHKDESPVIAEKKEEIISSEPEQEPVIEELPVISEEPETSGKEKVEEDKRPGFFIPKVESQTIEQLPVSSGKAKVWWSVAAVIVVLAGSSIFFFQRYPLNAWNSESTDINIVADSILDNIINEMLIEPDSMENQAGEDYLENTAQAINSVVSDNTNQQDSEDENNTSGKDIIATVQIKAGNRLTLIALEYYGNKVFWVYLYEHNKALIKDPNNVPIGTEIIVPAPELYNINPNSKASIEKAALLQSQILSAL